MPQPLSGPEYAIIIVAAAVIIFNFVWGITRPRKYRSTHKREEPKKTGFPKNDARVMWRAYKAARRDGLSISASIQDATDVTTEYQTTGKVPDAARKRIESIEQEAPSRRARIVAVTHAILVNAVTVIGVFQMRWPVGTALALYWSETLVSAILLLILVLIWQFGRDVSAGLAEFLGVSLIFNAAHFVFLLAFLGVMLPKYAPAERFERHSFEQGLLLIAAVLFLEFLVHAVSVRRETAADMNRSAMQYMQRIGLLHLTIIFGMFALALFGSARAFFAVFAGLKTLVELTNRVGT